MEQQEIIEGNSLIAEFMGWELYTPKYKGLMSLFNKYDTVCYDICGLGITPRQMKYHSSWDRLNPVVEAISRECDSNGDARCYWHSESAETDIRIFRESKETTYKEVVKFIKWYNEQKLKK